MNFFTVIKSLIQGFSTFILWKEPRSSEQILDDFYEKHPEIERDDAKALENDWKKIL